VKVGAIELGGTHASGAAVDLEAGSVSSWSRIGFAPDATREELLSAILEAARETSGLQAVGVAAPGPFDYARGVCLIAGVGKLDALFGVDLRAKLACALDLDPGAVAFVNDAEAFALGEAWRGSARDCERAIAVTLGTGFGAAFLSGGGIVREGAGVPPGGVFYPLPFRGAPVEDRISRRGILAAYGGGPELDVADVAARARDGDGPALAAFRQLGADLAEFLGPWVDAFAPRRVVVGGSIARAWELFAEPLVALGPGLAVPARHLDEAPLFGAARYAVS
jgi:glucokinase